MDTEITEYKLHEYRQGRHAFAGRRLFKSSDAGAVMDFAKTLRGFSYAMIKTTTLVIRSETDDEDTLTYTESSYTILYRPAQGFHLRPATGSRLRLTTTPWWRSAWRGPPARK